MHESPHRTSTPALKEQINAYLTQHMRALLSSLGRLVQAPLGTLMTISVIAIALALPAGFYILLKNVQHVSGNWDSAAKISVYLKLNTDRQRTELLQARIARMEQVAATRLIDRETALREFQALSGFGQAMQALDENPLPAVIEITPRLQPDNPLALEQLANTLRAQRDIDNVQIDMLWVKRLYSIINIVQRSLLIIAGMLGIAVVLVIGNTIRLDIQNRRSEIVVIKLIGGTDAFIRRPFLYTGIWYGLLGGILAWIQVSGALWLLRSGAQQLAGLYDSQYQLITLSLTQTLHLILAAVLLGYLGSWLAVSRHLKEIEPG